MTSDRLTIWIEKGPNMPGREWSARFIAQRCGLPFRIAVLPTGESSPEGAALYYGRAANAGGVVIRPSTYFDTGLETRRKIDTSPPAQFAGLPVPFASTQTPAGKPATGDVLASAFHIANRLEEPASPERDEHGRFPAAESLEAKLGVIDTPILDRYAGELSRTLETLYPGLARAKRWADGDFVVCLTHDIDCPVEFRRLGYLKSKLTASARALSNGRVTQAARQGAAGITRLASGKGPAWSFERLRRAERPAPGTYYFFARTSSPRDGKLNLASGGVRKEALSLAAQGCEIGVHFGYETGVDEASITAQKKGAAKALGRTIRGGRYHYLRTSFPAVWKACDAAGLTYEASLGYVKRPGFRGGTSLPYRPFDVEGGRTLDIFAVPLVAMDGTFLQYMGLDAAETADAVARLAHAVREVGGVFVLLWHNTMVDPVDKPEAAKAHTSVMETLKEMSPRFMTVGECVETWRKHAQSLEA